MKRSEVIDKLSKLTCDSNFTTVDILDFIENEIGMIPPEVTLSAGGEFIKTTELLDYSEIDYELGWEPEDEQ